MAGLTRAADCLEARHAGSVASEVCKLLLVPWIFSPRCLQGVSVSCSRGGLSDGAGSTLAACSKIFKKRLCPVLLRLNNWHDVFLTVRLVDLALPVNTQLRCDAVSHR